MNQLDEEILKCRKCPEIAAAQGGAPIPGTGTITPGGIVVLGTGITKDDHKANLPFQGPPGDALREAVIRAGLEDITFYSTLLKCCPPGKREPSPKEIENCKGWLYKQLEILQPLLIITVGKISTGGMQDKPSASVPILRIAGQTYKAGKWNCLATMDPAYVKRRRGDKDLALSFIGHFRIAKGHFDRFAALKAKEEQKDGK